MPDDLTPDQQWLLRMAEKEGNGITSVGGLVYQALKGERESMPADPILPYITTTATVPEEVVVGDKSKDWTISLLEERLESRIIITKKLEAEVRSLDSGRIDREYQINRLKGEVDDARDVANKLADEKNELRKENRSLRAELAKRDETIAKLREDRDTIQRDYSTACFERDKDLTSLRAQLARAEAIKAKAKKVLATWVQCGPNAPVFESVLKELSSEIDRPPGTPAPESAEHKCPHCGRPAEPINLTCGGCGEWLSKPSPGPCRTVEAEQEAKWISVKDRLPNDNHLWCGPFLVYPFDNGPTAYYSPRRGRWEDHGTRGVDHEITHWSELQRPARTPEVKP